jgi:hypothetical protein
MDRGCRDGGIKKWRYGEMDRGWIDREMKRQRDTEKERLRDKVSERW